MDQLSILKISLTIFLMIAFLKIAIATSPELITKHPSLKCASAFAPTWNGTSGCCCMPCPTSGCEDPTGTCCGHCNVQVTEDYTNCQANPVSQCSSDQSCQGNYYYKYCVNNQCSGDANPTKTCSLDIDCANNMEYSLCCRGQCQFPSTC